MHQLCFQEGAGLRGRPAGRLPKAPNSKEVLRSHCHNLKYGASKLRYLNGYFSENCQLFQHAFSKIFASHFQGRKSLKNIGLNWRQIISQAGAPTCLGPALISKILDFVERINFLGVLGYILGVKFLNTNFLGQLSRKRKRSEASLIPQYSDLPTHFNR
jgi:hypothetical protein